MGIRFYCPNGHKLNVKEFQAGRKGICPYCAAKFVVPLESTRKSSKELREEQAASAAEGGAVPEPPVMHQADPGAAASADPGHLSGVPPAAEPEKIPAAVQAQPETPAAAAPAARMPDQSPDPLTEAGDVVWYVRPPSGGQFGPAGPDIMQEWINEGRVSADSLVWREGWGDWQEASAVFPRFSASEASPQSVGAAAGTTSVSPNIDVTVGTTTESARTPWHPKTVQAAIISALMLAIILLLAVFMFVLFRDSGESRSVENPPATASGRRAILRETTYQPVEKVGSGPIFGKTACFSRESLAENLDLTPSFLFNGLLSPL